jgi:hypothetical protein
MGGQLRDAAGGANRCHWQTICVLWDIIDYPWYLSGISTFLVLETVLVSPCSVWREMCMDQTEQSLSSLRIGPRHIEEGVSVDG